jgi:hypothetical protein
MVPAKVNTVGGVTKEVLVMLYKVILPALESHVGQAVNNKPV